MFDAPRELVWKAYTDPKHIVKWAFSRRSRVESA
ncbi:MAG: SRPBCC domain-containing protein [Chloroflexota bacterium]